MRASGVRVRGISGFCVFAFAFFLAACGGGGGGGGGGASNSPSPPAPPSPPATPLALFAGDLGGPGNVDGTGVAARFNTPQGIATDSAGNVYVVDTNNNTIRKISLAGAVTTLAGTAGVSGSADGTGAAANFTIPHGIATDSAGNVYVADFSTIRKITPAGVVTTFAGTSTLSGFVSVGALGGVATDSTGNIYLASNVVILKITPAGVVSTLAGSIGAVGSADGTGAAASFFGASSVATDSAGNVYVADTNNCTIRKITPAGAVTTLAGTPSLLGGNADGVGAAASFRGPQGVATDGADNVYVADTGNGLVRKVTPAGLVTTLAGSRIIFGGSADGAGASAGFSQPRGIAVDSTGTVYVADTANHAVRKITPAGVVTTLGGVAPLIGNVDGTGAAARFFSSGGTNGIAADTAGNVYVADFGNNNIRKITPARVVTTFAGSTLGLSGSTDSTGAAARFHGPIGVATDSEDNLYVADTINSTIRKITPGGVVTTLAGTAGVGGSANGTGAAASFQQPVGVATDSIGNVYVADTINNAIRKITPGGVVTTFAGATVPQGIATDRADNVYVTDGNAIRKITPAGLTTTLAGSVSFDGSADGTGAAARFFFPRGIATDTAGNIYVADSGASAVLSNNTIRKITPAGVVTTVVGVAGQASFAPGALPGLLCFPQGVAVSGTSLYITLYNGVAVASNVASDSNSTLNLTTGQAVTLVLGQPNFTTGTAPAAINASSMSPVGRGRAVGNFYYQADRSAVVSRTLGFPLPLTSSESATIVLGATSLTAAFSGTGSAADFESDSTASDGINLVITDQNRNRVLVFSTAPTTTHASADFVLGQTTMTAGASGCSATTLNSPGATVAAPGKLIVSDSLNNRVLIWTQPITSNGQPADLVLGQPDMVSCTANQGSAAGQNTLSQAGGVWTDGTLVAVGDVHNNRMLIWKTFPTTNGQNADLVLGQPDFTSTTAGVSAAVIGTGGTAVSDATHFIVTDNNNNRILVWNSIPTVNGQAADVVLGQTDFTSNTAGTSATQLHSPGGVGIIDNHLFVTDQANNRVLMY